MNCPRCGSVGYPGARKCQSCDELLPKPASEQPAMHPLIAQRLRQLGFYRYADETKEEFRERCRSYVLGRYKGERAA